MPPTSSHSLTIATLLSPQAIRVPLVATERKAALEELVDALAATGAVTDAELFKRSVWEHEQQRSTGIGEGLAIPHGKCAGIIRPAITIGRPAAPMEFGAIDKKPVRLIVLLASPPDRIADHIQVLHRMSRLFSSVVTRERVCLAQDAAALYLELCQADASLADR